MSTFGVNPKDSQASRKQQHMSSHPNHNYDQRKSDQLEMSHRIPYNPSQRGMTNQGYLGTSIDEINTVHTRSNNHQNGHSNNGYLSSSDDGFHPSDNNNSRTIPISTISSARNGSHSTSRYTHDEPLDSNKNIKKRGCCQSRICRVVSGMIVLLALAGVAAFVGIYFGTDLIRKDGAPETTVTTPAVLLPDGDTFSGELKLNQTWSPDLADPNSAAFRTKSQQLSSFMDNEMSSNLLLGSSYNSTQVISLQSGSIVVRFIITFTTPIVLDQLRDALNTAIATNGSNLNIIVESIIIADFIEDSVCGLDDLLLCDGVCRSRSAIACNSIKDCSDWYDEFNCPGESASCDFEQSGNCGYIVQENNHDGYQWIYNSGDTASPDTGPQHDQTYQNESGHYYYTEWCNSCQHGDIALLTSPWYVTREQACLSFYYHMKGHPTEMGPLYLSAYDKLDIERLLWTKENPDSEDQKGLWRQVNIDIAPGSYRFIFSSFFHIGSDRGDKAIDDVLIKEGACSDLPVCNETLYCPITHKCLPTSDRPLCNGKFDCPDGSDEENCAETVYKASFESGSDLSTYSLTNVTTNPFYQWLITSTTPSPFLGTYFDNTYRNPLGHYITVLPGYIPQIPSGTESRLIIKQDFSGSQERCLQFAYNMYYEGSTQGTDGTLKVYARNLESGEKTELWSHSGSSGRDWVPVSYSVQAMAKSYHLEFVAVRLGGDGIVLSLDDITLMNGFCKCEDPSRRQCPDRTCIPLEWFCDGDQDCANGEDEVNCPVCAIEDFLCRDRSCVPGGESIKCDGTYDCADGSDEDACVSLDQCGTEECIKLDHPEGHLEVCAVDWNMGLNSDVCRYLYKGPKGSSGATQASPTSTQFLRLNGSSNEGFMARFTKVDSCPNKLVVKVVCEEEICGRRQPSLSPYIIGGEETTELGRWPWQVDLRYRGLHLCGATLLTPHWIVTAAHCIDDYRDEVELLSVNLGTISVYPGQANSLEVDVKRIKDPDFESVVLGDDIALLFIEQPINYTDVIKPACLPNVDDVYNTRSKCYITGWGRTEETKVYPDNLQEAKYKLTSTSSCNASWSNVNIRESMMCAGYQSGTIRTCKGDSGGPLVCLDKYKRWTLVGITSFGPGGCLLENHKDDVFTRVSKYLSWIDNITNFQFNCTNGRKILDKERLCDAVDDCGDNSDEVLPCTLSVQCDFATRNWCGYTLGGWSNATGLASRTGSLDNTGPSFDHTTGTSESSSVYMVTSTNGAVLTTALHNATDTTCLQFFYYLSYSSKIEISIFGNFFANVDGAAGVWQRAQVTLPTGEYAVVFKAIIPQPSYVAIDDVTVSEGACSGACPSGMFKCQTQCIRDKFVCDGVSHCLDSSDERNCGTAVNTIKCSFDEPFACGLRQLNADDFNMLIRYNSLLPGPASGHIDDTEERDVSYILATGSKSYQKSIVEWPIKLSVPSCMTFWYYMDGNNVGSLEVRSGGVKLWQEFGSQGRQWLRARVPVKAGKSVEIRVQAGKENANEVALDDFSVTAGNCPAVPTCDPVIQFTCPGKCIDIAKKCDRTVDCYDMSDEAACGWTVDCNFTADCPNYTLSEFLASYKWSRDNAGGYLTANARNADRGAMAWYTSAPFSLTSNQCLTFRYLLDGGLTANPELRVTLKELTINRETVLWRNSLNHSAWRMGSVTVHPTDQSAVSLVFHALFGGNKTVLLSLDDIQLSPGSCSHPACPGQFLCPYEDVCIPSAAKCDGIYDCQGGVDETNCGDLAQKLDCNFDEGTCGWNSSESRDLDLVRQSGSTPVLETGPNYDHTQNNLVGFYLYLSTPSKSIPSGDVRFTAPTVQLSTKHCLTFHYHMTGVHVGYLNLTNADLPNGQPLLSVDGAHGSAEWHVAKVTIDATDSLTLQFIFTSTGVFSNTAIDDITFRNGTCDCSNDHQCPTSGECFDNLAKCDNIHQCGDLSDEENCGCPGDAIMCAEDCLPPFIICEFVRSDCLSQGQSVDCGCNSTYQRSCDKGFCYDSFAHCNGFADCDDSSDEKPGCGKDCPPGHIPCTNLAKCIPESSYCDGNIDCADSSDEFDGCKIIAPGSNTPSASPGR